MRRPHTAGRPARRIALEIATGPATLTLSSEFCPAPGSVQLHGRSDSEVVILQIDDHGRADSFLHEVLRWTLLVGLTVALSGWNRVKEFDVGRFIYEDTFTCGREERVDVNDLAIVVVIVVCSSILLLL